MAVFQLRLVSAFFFVVQLAQVFVNAEVFVVREWLQNNNVGFNPITVNQGDTVLFETSNLHDIAVVPTLEEFNACDMTNVKILNDSGLDELALFIDPNDPDVAPGPVWVVCSVANGGHCSNGQKITINVVEVTEAPTASPVEPFVYDIPWRLPVGVAAQDEQLLQKIAVFEGDVVNWNDFLSSAHNVFEFDTLEEFQNCDFTNATDLNQGEASVNITVSGTQTRWFGCKVGNHCEQGMKLAVTVIEREDTVEIDWIIPADADQLDPIDVSSGDVLEFIYNEAVHELHRFRSKEAFDACDFTGAVDLTGDNFVHDPNVTETSYYGCRVVSGEVDHCASGQKLEVRLNRVIDDGDDDDDDGNEFLLLAAGCVVGAAIFSGITVLGLRRRRRNQMPRTDYNSPLRNTQQQHQNVASTASGNEVFLDIPRESNDSYRESDVGTAYQSTFAGSSPPPGLASPSMNAARHTMQSRQALSKINY